MLVRLTFVKRFLKDNFLYRKGRVYNVDEAMGLALCGLTDKDLPMFTIVAPDRVGDTPIVSLQIEDEVEDIPVKQQNVSIAETKTKRKTVSKKAPKKASKKTAKLKKPVAKAATEEPSSNVVQV